MNKIIDANELTIEALLNRSGEAYKVPRHQRQFEWGKEHWEDLWDDIHAEEINESHFLGSIVVIPEGRPSVGINYYEVNDGQQRLTTILILLSVIRDMAVKLNNKDFAEHILEHYLTANCFEGGSKRVYLKMMLGKLDNKEFEDVLNGKLQNDKKENHRIFECYNYFKSKIENINFNELEDLKKRVVNKIIIVHINVSDKFNAFRLFQTLNDRGLALSAVDLIKNYLLMRAASIGPEDAIIDSIVDEWIEMYELIRKYEPLIFLHRFMLSEYPGKVSQNQLYEKIEDKAKKEKWDANYILEFTNKLKKAAIIYTELLDANIGNVKINRRLSDIKLIEASPSYTLLLKITPLFKDGLLDEKQYLKIIDYIELFHIRWGITGQSTSRLSEIYNKMCTKLSSTSVEETSKMVEDEYLSWSSPIKDSIFHSAFQEEFGNPAATRTKFLIWKLGNPTGEISLNIEEIHTEHIMPQTLNDGWFSDLEKSSGMEKEEIKKTHDVLVNKIGNFALIKGEWNISMSNRVFSEKVKHYIKSDITLTQDLSNRKSWAFEDVITRTVEFADKAIQMWKFSKPIPETDISSGSLKLARKQYGVTADIDLFCKGPNANAIANIADNNSLIVRGGSFARLEVAPNFIDHNYKKLRDKLVNDGILEEEGDSFVFTVDYKFASASAAAAVVLGRSADGPSEWKDKNNKSIAELTDISNGISGGHKNDNHILQEKFLVNFEESQSIAILNLKDFFENTGWVDIGSTADRMSFKMKYSGRQINPITIKTDGTIKFRFNNLISEREVPAEIVNRFRENVLNIFSTQPTISGYYKDTIYKLNQIIDETRLENLKMALNVFISDCNKL